MLTESVLDKEAIKKVFVKTLPLKNVKKSKPLVSPARLASSNNSKSEKKNTSRLMRSDVLKPKNAGIKKEKVIIKTVKVRASPIKKGTLSQRFKKEAAPKVRKL